MKTEMIAILLSCLCIQAYAGTEGHGGDPLRLLFEDARPFAADRVLKSESCAFGANVSAEVRNWILTHKQSLAEDISQSKHVWITDKQSTCAFTQTSSRADITFSFETCRPGVRDISDALKILVHESVHHFGIADEYFADKVADAIYNLGSYSACTIPPSENPFDPASCPGSALTSNELMNLIPLPNSNQKDLGEFKVSTRKRTCYSANWCSVWTDTSDWKSFYGWAGSYVGLSRGGPLKVLLQDNIPYLKYVSGVDWVMFGRVLGSQLTSERTHRPDNSFLDLMVGGKSFREQPPIGWITNSCARQTITVGQKDKDNLNNDVIVEYEAVFLSQFK